MVCKSNVFVGTNEHNKNWKNWSGDVLFSAEEYFEPAHTSPTGPPDGLLQLVHVVARATSENKRLKAIGSGWAFEDIAKSDSWVVSLRQLARRLDNVIGPTGAALTDEWKLIQGNSGDVRLVHVEAGIEIGELSEILRDDPEHLALPTMGGSNGQSLAGAISTSTHGGDWQKPPLPDLVRAIHLVTDGGRELWIERASAPITTDERLKAVLTCPDTEIVRDDEIFNAALVSFGRFGVIYSFVLEVRKQFREVEVVTTPARSDVVQALRDGQSGTRLFGPLFTLLSNTAPPAGLAEGLMNTGFFSADPYFFQILFSSQNPNNCWVTRRWETIEPDDLPAGLTVSTELTPGGVFVVAHLAFSTAAALAMALFPVVGLYFASRLLYAATEFTERAASGKTVGAAVSSALNAAWELPFVGNIIPDITYMVLNGNFNESVQTGRRGPHHLITSGTRANSHKFDFLVDSIEVIFDATTPQYLDFLDVILNAGPSFKQSGYISLRPSRASRAELSMHNVAGSHAISIEVSTIQGLPDNQTWMAHVQREAMQRGGRPHWGQYNKLTEQQVVSLYHERLINWRESLLRVSMESTIFSNNFTRQRGLEPTNIVREVTAVHKTTGVVTDLCGAAGAAWSPINVRDAIRQIQSNTVMYFTRAANRVAVVEVVNDAKVGGLYLRTTPDDTQANNLDNLPKCAGAPPPTEDDAQFSSQTLPLGIVSGVKKKGKIVMYNTGTSVWQAGKHFLISTPGSQITISPTAITSPASPLQQSVFTFDITGGPSGTKAILICRMMKNGQAFGAESEEATIFFTSANESPQCETIRKKMVRIQMKIANLEESLNPAGDPHAQAKTRTAILDAERELAAERSRGSQLQCTLP